MKRELRSAVEQLVESQRSDEAIHEARKSIKRVRATLRLIRKGVPDITRRDEALLRQSGRLLSPQRDTDALLETARDLCSHYPRTRKKEMCEALSQHLATNKARAQRAATVAKTRTQAVEALQAMRRSAKRWDLKHARFSVLAKGLKRVYRAARKAIPGRERVRTARRFIIGASGSKS